MIPIFVFGFISIVSVFSDSEGKIIHHNKLWLDSFQQAIPGDTTITQDSLNVGTLDTTAIPADSASLYLADSTLIADSLKLDSLSIDSSARLKYFRKQLKPNYIYNLSTPRRSKFFAYPSVKTIQRTVELDSTGQFVLIKEKSETGKEKLFMKMTLSEYIDMKLRAQRKEDWRRLGYSYEYDDGKTDLTDIFSDITNIEIPLPSTSFLSIFGPPKISLRISGAVDIRGAWRNETTEGVTASALGNTRNEPDFKQQVQINVAGTIGDKLTISADWNTERTFEYENQLKIHYEGYDDEIVQSVEAGNVSLQTASLVGGSEALFGIKALLQFGPFSLTALASQKKGEVEEVSVSGGSETQEFTVRAYEYSKNHYFLDEVYADPDLNIFNNFFGEPTPIVDNSLRVKDIEVWKTTTAIVDPAKERKANAFIDLPDRRAGGGYEDEFFDITQNEVAGRSIINGRFVLLEEGLDYTLHAETGFISFRSQVQKEDAIAVAYRVENGPGADDDLYYGQFLNEVNESDTSSVIILKLVKPKNLQPGGDFETAWSLQLKNIYPIGGRDIKKEGFELQIKYQEDTGDPVSDFEGIPYIELFGLDKQNADGSRNQPDGAFDYRSNYTIFPQTGEIVFPTLQPFGEQFPDELPEDRRYQEVYDELVTFAQQEKAKDRFTITGEYSASVSSTFNIGFNVVENSVEVFLGGRKLNPGTDYMVDYNIGQVTIINDDALVPGADLRITYEQNDLFQLASKTLLGLRGIYEFDKQSHIGFSFLNLNQQTLSDKVRIGEEPLNNTIYGIDLKTQFDLPFITSGLDNIISTSEMSTIDINAEYAYINPEPNTKTSTINSDENKSIAYIDDFEGSKRIIPIGNNYGQWKDLSPPVQNQYLTGIASTPDEIKNFKAFSYWYNLIPAVDDVNDIWPERQASRDNQKVTVLDFVYEPEEQGRNNWEPILDDPLLNYGGLMKGLSSTASNLVEENIEFIEFWLQIPEAPDDAMLNIDLGQISEDVVVNGNLDSEDKNQNDLIDEGEDLGVDGLADQDEPGYDPVNNPDPSRDNFNFSQGAGDYRFINGTEGNAELTDVGRLPDTEDLNRNLTLDRINSFFRYTVPLDTVRENNSFIQGGGGENAGWYLFRVPVREFTEEIGNPSLTLVETIRIWVGGVSQPVHLRFAEMNLVGNQWRKVLDEPRVTEDDKVLEVTTISIEENPEYNSPPGVERERDRSQPDEEVFKNEQSLNLILRNLEDGDKREIVKYLYKPLDLFNYREMKMFLHGDLFDSRGSVSYYKDEKTYSAEIYFKFGSDTSNYYEYRQPVRRGWNEVGMMFSELTAIKAQREFESEVFRQYLEGKEGASYAIKGSPSLTRVSFFIIGIENPKYSRDGTRPENFGEPVSGSVWVNELRVLDAEDTPGWAYTASTKLKFADLMTVDLNTRQTNPFFHRLADRFGNRIDERSWGINVNFDVLKLIPVNLQGSNLKINYSRRESISKPLYLPGTDVNVEAAAEQRRLLLIEQGFSEEAAQAEADRIIFETQSVSVTDTWSLSNIKFVIPTDAWYIEETINNLSFGFNYNITKSRNSTTLKNEKWVWNANANYNLNFSRENFFKPVDIPIIGDVLGIFEDYKDVKIYFSPQKFDASFTAARNRSLNVTRTENSEPKIQRDFTTTRKFGFNWTITEGGALNLGLNYSANFQSSLTDLLTRQIGIDENDEPITIERSESEIWSEIFSGVLFGTDYNFKQTFDITTKPKLPSIWGLDNNFNISLGYSVSYNWSNNFTQPIVGRSAGWSNRINAGLNIRWKSLFDPLFKEAPSEDQGQRGGGRTGGRGGRGTTRNTRGDRDVDQAIAQADTASNGQTGEELTEDDDSPSTISVGFSYLKAAIQYVFFDYDQIRFNFSQTNSFSSSGLAGEGTGFNNFWGFSENYAKGPTRAFMLGFSYDAGPRAPNGNLRDNFAQKNNFDFSTSRPLWEGAKIDINWKVGWGINKSTTIETDDDGNVMITNINSSGTLDRTFLSVPSFLFFDFFDNGIGKVASLYNPNADNPNENLSNAFVEGFETFPWLAKIPLLKEVMKYLPRPNWNVTWSGLEKISFLKDIAQRVQLRHAYTSKYTEGWKIDPDGDKQIQTQKISYGFSPLLGISVTLPEMFGGNMTGSIQYNTMSNYDLGTTSRNITEGFSKDISFTASYSKSGFEIPLFGLSLQNDIEISLSYTTSENSTVIYEMDDYNEEGTPQDGTTRTSIEPRIKYVMSSRVTLSLFYKRTTVEPKGAARIPPTTTNEAGLEVHISIQ